MGIGVAGALALAALSGGSSADPRTPVGLPGLAAPFLGTAVLGSGGLIAAVDAYGDVVDLRVPGPVGAGLIENTAARQYAGSVPSDTGIVPRVRVDGGPAMGLWRADSVHQRYLRGTGVLRTVARFGAVRVTIADAAIGRELARVVSVAAPPGGAASVSLGVDVEAGRGVACRRQGGARRIALLCSAGTAGRPNADEAASVIGAAAGADRRWVARARPLGADAPAWARRMYGRSLLTLRALSDRRTGAVAAGARDGWAYVWPRDAAGAALGFEAAGYAGEARRIARFLRGLDLGAAARFDGRGEPVPGRAAQGDAAGWVAAASLATGLGRPLGREPWRGRADYQEGDPGDYLGNAIASGGSVAAFEGPSGLVRRAGDPGSGLDSAAAWAVRPFRLAPLFPAARESLLRLARSQTRFGIEPGEEWPGADPWTAPTAWTAWSLAALGDRGQALRLLADLRRAATPAGELPERLDARRGIPRSTTPLALSHAFAILVLRQLWPQPPGACLSFRRALDPLAQTRPRGGARSRFCPHRG